MSSEFLIGLIAGRGAAERLRMSEHTRALEKSKANAEAREAALNERLAANSRPGSRESVTSNTPANAAGGSTSPSDTVHPITATSGTAPPAAPAPATAPSGPAAPTPSSCAAARPGTLPPAATPSVTDPPSVSASGAAPPTASASGATPSGTVPPKTSASGTAPPGIVPSICSPPGPEPDTLAAHGIKVWDFAYATGAPPVAPQTGTAPRDTTVPKSSAPGTVASGTASSTARPTSSASGTVASEAASSGAAPSTARPTSSASGTALPEPVPATLAAHGIRVWDFAYATGAPPGTALPGPVPAATAASGTRPRRSASERVVPSRTAGPRRALPRTLPLQAIPEDSIPPATTGPKKSGQNDSIEADPPGTKLEGPIMEVAHGAKYHRSERNINPLGLSHPTDTSAFDEISKKLYRYRPYRIPAETDEEYTARKKAEEEPLPLYPSLEWPEMVGIGRFRHAKNASESWKAERFGLIEPRPRPRLLGDTGISHYGIYGRDDSSGDEEEDKVPFLMEVLQYTSSKTSAQTKGEPAKEATQPEETQPETGDTEKENVQADKNNSSEKGPSVGSNRVRSSVVRKPVRRSKASLATRKTVRRRTSPPMRKSLLKKMVPANKNIETDKELQVEEKALEPPKVNGLMQGIPREDQVHSREEILETLSDRQDADNDIENAIDDDHGDAEHGALFTSVRFLGVGVSVMS